MTFEGIFPGDTSPWASDEPLTYRYGDIEVSVTGYDDLAKLPVGEEVVALRDISPGGILAGIEARFGNMYPEHNAGFYYSFAVDAGYIDQKSIADALVSATDDPENVYFSYHDQDQNIICVSDHNGSLVALARVVGSGDETTVIVSDNMYFESANNAEGIGVIPSLKENMSREDGLLLFLRIFCQSLDKVDQAIKRTNEGVCMFGADPTVIELDLRYFGAIQLSDLSSGGDDPIPLSNTPEVDEQDEDVDELEALYRADDSSSTGREIEEVLISLEERPDVLVEFFDYYSAEYESSYHENPNDFRQYINSLTNDHLRLVELLSDYFSNLDVDFQKRPFMPEDLLTELRSESFGDYVESLVTDDAERTVICFMNRSDIALTPKQREEVGRQLQDVLDRNPDLTVILVDQDEYGDDEGEDDELPPDTFEFYFDPGMTAVLYAKEMIRRASKEGLADFYTELAIDGIDPEEIDMLAEELEINHTEALEVLNDLERRFLRDETRQSVNNRMIRLRMQAMYNWDASQDK